MTYTLDGTNPMKRIVTFALIAFAFIAPVAFTGCGDDKASKPIEKSDLKAPAKTDAPK